MSELDRIIEAAHSLTEAQRKAGYYAKGLYLYTDTDGVILFARLRMDHATKDKWVRPLSCDDSGHWKLKEPTLKKGQKPIYNLQKLANEPLEPVYVVEGEKCADALNALGLITTTSGGADSAKSADWKLLAGRDVVIWPDNDEPGTRYADDVTAILQALDCSVKRIDIAPLELPHKGDCADWLEGFKTANGKQATRADVEALPLKVDAIQGDLAQYNEAGDALPLSSNLTASVSLICAADIQPEAIDWLWNGWLAKGKLHIFAGQAGTGKTTISMALASTISTGGYFPDGARCPQGSVLIWSGEDSVSDTLKPRLMASGANCNKVFFVDGTNTTSEGKRAFDPASDMEALMLQAGEIPDLALMIIDPIVNAVAGDSHKNSEVRRDLQPVVDFGEKLKCAVLGITHFSKGGQGKEPLERVTGSLAFGALARIVLATAKIDDGDKSKRIVCRAKSNIGVDHGGFEYDLQEKEVQAGIFSSYALWGEAIEGSARELLAEPDNRYQGEGGNSALDDAKEFLSELLADGELAQPQIKKEAKEAGHSWRTVERAKKALGIKSSKSKLDSRWYWRLLNPATNDQERQDSHINNAADMAELPITPNIDDDKARF